MALSASCVIVGAGILGSSVAYHLDAMGYHDFILLDADDAIHSASSLRSAAMLVHQTTDRTTTELAIRSIRGYAALSAAGEDIDYRHTGGLLFTSRSEKYDELAAQASYQTALGLSTHLLSVGDMASKCGSLLDTDGLAWGLFCDDEGCLNPQSLLDVYQRVAGARLSRGSGVREVRTTVGRVSGVLLDSGDLIECESVVNAAGGSAGLLAAPLGISIPLQRSERSLVVLQPPSPNVFGPNQFLVEDLEDEWYFRPHPLGVMAGIGPTFPVQEGSQIPDPQLRPGQVDLLRGYVARRMPGLNDFTVLASWAGYRHMLAGASDEWPVLGPVSGIPGYYDCCGAGAYGITLAGVCGELVAGSIAGEDSSMSLSQFSSDRFRGMGV